MGAWVGGDGEVGGGRYSEARIVGVAVARPFWNSCLPFL